jgi:hypothetical protein
MGIHHTSFSFMLSLQNTWVFMGIHHTSFSFMLSASAPEHMGIYGYFKKHFSLDS